MRVYVRKFKVNPFHDCIATVLGKELFMGASVSCGHTSSLNYKFIIYFSKEMISR